MLRSAMLVPVLVLLGACATEPTPEAGKEQTAKAERPCEREAESTGSRIRRCTRDSAVNVLSPDDMDVMRSRGATGMTPGAGGR